MTTRAKTKVRVNLEEDKEILRNAVKALKKSMDEHKKERKADWTVFKSKFKKDMDSINKSLKVLLTEGK